MEIGRAGGTEAQVTRGFGSMDRSAPRPQENTGDLLRRAQAGDVAAQRVLYGEHRAWAVREARHHPCFLLAKSLLLSDEDIVQEMFVRLFEKPELLDRFEYRGPGSLKRLLRTVLDRTIKDSIQRLETKKRGRGWKRRELDADGELPGRPLANDSREPTPFTRATGRRLIDRARAILPADHFEAWRRVRIEELTYAAVAAKMGKSASTIHALVEDADLRIRGSLAP